MEFTTNTRNKNVSAVDISEWTLGLGREYGGVWGGGGEGDEERLRKFGCPIQRAEKNFIELLLEISEIFFRLELFSCFRFAR